MEYLYVFEVLVSGIDYFGPKKYYTAKKIEEISALVKEDYLYTVRELILQNKEASTLFPIEEIEIVYIRRGELLNNVEYKK